LRQAHNQLVSDVCRRLRAGMDRKPPSFLKWKRKRGSVSIELALVIALILFPLIAGCLDALYILIVRYEANQALQSVYLFAWSNPSDASSGPSIQDVLNLDNQSALATFKLGSAPSTSSSCLLTSTSSVGNEGTSLNGVCPTGTTGILQTNVSYQIVTSIDFPIPFIVFAQNYQFSISGQIVIQ
jgi:uncharacterized protein (UPF0333 family)